MNFHYEIKEKIVRAGGSKIFKNWHDFAGITMEEFLDGLRWLCDDPMPNGKLYRQLGCIAPEDAGLTDEQKKMWGTSSSHLPGTAGIHRLSRCYYSDGSLAGFYYKDGTKWTGYVSLNAKDGV